MSRRTLALLAAAVVLRMAFHAVYVPAFEGPDEPQHLARVLDFALRPPGEALAGRWVDADVLASVLSYPCPRREHGCPPYGSAPGAFNLVRAAPPATLRVRDVHRIPNEEAKQPPLFYAATGFVLRALRAVGSGPVSNGGSPAETLLAVRVFNVLLIALALFGPLRSVFRESPGIAGAGLVAMLTPGACEAFARCSNDAAVFLWASLVVFALRRGARGAFLAALLAPGPLLKLTALAVCAYAVVLLWTERRTRAAVACALASIAALPLRGPGGWGLAAGPAAPELPAIGDTLGEWLLGLARTAYSVVKQPYWAGGWHNFRVPAGLVALYGALLLAAFIASRIAPRRRLLPLAAGVLVVLAGTVAYGVSVRQRFGIWGGLAGWYVWDWAPWLASAAADIFVVERRFARLLLAAECAFVVAANVWWFAIAGGVYSG